jgi:hypothetical protein
MHWKSWRLGGKLYLPLLCTSVCLLTCASVWGQQTDQADEARFFLPAPGYTRVRDLPDNFRGKVAAIDLDIKDAFDGTEAHSEAEEKLYELGDKLHVNTRKSTLRRRLLFTEGDTVTADLLRENEKNLRAEQFLADAFIEVKRQSDSTLLIKITTYDQWTTVPSLSLSRKGGEWIWYLGPVESNLLGTGDRLGFFVGHTLEDNTQLIDFENTAFTPLKLQLSIQAALLQDNYTSSDNGYSYSVALNRPLLARTDKWGVTFSTTGLVSAEDLYLSGNDLDKLSKEGRLDSNGQALLGQTNLLGQFGRTSTYNTYASITRSFGYVTKTSISPFYQSEVRYLSKSNGYNPLIPASVRDSLGFGDSEQFDSRRDQLLGLSLSVYQYAYKTVENFHNLKWSETLETGWRLSASLAQDETWLGAHRPEWQFTYAGVYNDAWDNQFFLNTNASLQYFVSPDSGFDNGSTTAYAEGQWKPVSSLSTLLSGSYQNLFAVKPSQQLYLGGESGLNGFPDYYYVGHARVLFAAEERYFPPFEFGTLVPAFAAFVDAGNTYSAYDSVDVRDLHYAVGVGLRLGASRSVQKVVNHIDLSWPIGERNLGPWSFFKYFSISASKTL